MKFISKALDSSIPRLYIGMYFVIFGDLDFTGLLICIVINACILLFDLT